MRHILRLTVAILVLASCASQPWTIKSGFFPPLTSPQPHGVLHLHFRAGYSKEQQQLIVGKIMPYLDQVFGQPWQTMNIDVYGGSHSPSSSTAFAHFDNSGCASGIARGVIQVKDPSDLGAIANELTHAHHGCFTFSEERFEEGFSFAGNILSSYHLGLKKDPCTPYLCVGILYKPNNKLGIGGGEEFDHDTTGGLAEFREEMGGMAWSQFETDHPGFLQRTNDFIYKELLQQQMSAGGLIKGPKLAIDPNKDASLAAPSFSSWYAGQHIFDDRPKGNIVILVGALTQLTVIATKRSAQGGEIAWINFSGLISINGDSSILEPQTLDGMTVLNLPKGQARVTASIKIGRLSDRISYVTTFPRSPYLGNVALKP